jgi:predicted acetyltransferase
MKIQKGYSEFLADNLTLRVASGELEDFQRFIAFNLTVHQDDSLKRYVSHLKHDHPRKNQIYWIYIEENDSKKIVSMITLMPVEWNFDGVTIPICEMELVGTLLDFRNRGFFGKLNKIYEAIMKQEGYLLSVIKGIPYYYRRFGYDFALNLDERIILKKNLIPSREFINVSFQKATKQDIPFIESVYNKEQEKFFISNRFHSDCFLSKFMNSDFDSNFLTTFLIKINGNPCSYFSFGMSYDNIAYSFVVPEVNEECMIKILQFISEYNENEDQIIFHVNSDTKFSQYIGSIGGKKEGSYGWQIKILDPKTFLKAIIPVLERRIENSSFKGLSQDFVISNYQESFVIRFKDGEVEKIEVKKGYPLPGFCDVKIPGSNLIKLLLSDKNFKEIKYIIKDSILKPESEGLCEVLFPKMPSIPDTYY